MIHSLPRRGRRMAFAGAAAALASLALASGAMANAPTNSGTFVIGDQEANVGSQVTFWGAQWWTDNPLSTGLAPASFKGFAVNAPASCGATSWTTDPGNSSHPPATVDTTGPVAMIVSSQISKSGSVISGDVAEIAYVQVDSGYSNDPGHPGTGTVTSVVPCDGSGSGSGGDGSGSGGGIILS